MSRLLVIFGAGASFDSAPGTVGDERVDHLRPPLTKDLFSEGKPYRRWLQIYTGANGIVPALRRRIESGDNLESLLRELYDNGTETDSAALTEVKRYLRSAIADVTDAWSLAHDRLSFYQELVHDIRRWQELQSEEWDVSYVTFNYDTLLDQAMASERVIRDDGSPTSWTEGHTTLFRPHGSVGWFRDSAGLHNSLTWKDDWVTPIGYDQDPLLAIPMDAKEESELVWTQRHQDTFVEALQNVHVVLIIGWRGAETHFTRLLRAHLPSRSYFRVACHDGYAETEANLVDAGLWDIKPVAMDAGVHERRQSESFGTFIGHGGWDRYVRTLLMHPSQLTDAMYLI